METYSQNGNLIEEDMVEVLENSVSIQVKRMNQKTIILSIGNIHFAFNKEDKFYKVFLEGAGWTGEVKETGGL
jgi:DNA polymerase III alpha subunit (gram-positive type)